MPYAVTKAAQLQLVKCLAVTVGPKIRVNTVLPGLLLTEWVIMTWPSTGTIADRFDRARNIRKSVFKASRMQPC